MIAVDTNVLVRFITNDDAAQAKRARLLIEAGPVFVAKTVLLELEWVLRGAYGLDRLTILKALRGLLGLPALTAEDEFNVARAVEWFEAGLDFADALHLASSGQQRAFATFDQSMRKRASRAVGGFEFVSP